MEVMGFVSKYLPLLIILLGVSVIAAVKFSFLALEKNNKQRLVDFDLNGNEFICFERVMSILCFLMAIGIGGALMMYAIWLMMNIQKF